MDGSSLPNPETEDILETNRDRHETQEQKHGRTAIESPAAFADVRRAADRAVLPQDGARSLRSVRDASGIARRGIPLDGGTRRGLPCQRALAAAQETVRPRGAPDGLLLHLLRIARNAPIDAERARRSTRRAREPRSVLAGGRNDALPFAGGSSLRVDEHHLHAWLLRRHEKEVPRRFQGRRSGDPRGRRREPSRRDALHPEIVHPRAGVAARSRAVLPREGARSGYRPFRPARP